MSKTYTHNGLYARQLSEKFLALYKPTVNDLARLLTYWFEETQNPNQLTFPTREEVALKVADRLGIELW
jgi:hypothetical protein